MTNNNKIFSVIKNYGGDKTSYLVPIIICQILSVIATLLPIYFIWQIIRTIFLDFPNFQIHTILSYLLWAVIYQLIAVFLTFGASLMAHFLAFEVENGLRRESFSHLLDLPLGYFQKHESGRIRKIIDDNASLTHTFLAHQLPDIIPAILISLALLISMFIVDFRLALVLIFSLVLATLAMAVSMKADNRKSMENYQYALENINTEGVEYFRGMPVVKVFQQSVMSFNSFYKAIKDYEKFCLDYTISFRSQYLIMNIALYLPYMLVPILCIFLLPSASNPQLMVSNAVFYILLAMVLNMNIMRIARLASGISSFNIAIEKINEILNIRPLEALESTRPGDQLKEAKPIVLDDISFSYDGKTDVIKNLSFTFEKGKSYALVGASGSGKTSLINLIARFYDVDDGNIYLKGENIKSMAEEEIFDHMSLVFQKQGLLKDSIFENVRMYDQSKTEIDVIEALDQANALDIIARLEDGLYTIYGSSGALFSGGEIQRIILARSFLKDSPIFLLNEATAFVDADNEEKILGAMENLKENRTTIMVLHRLSSAQNFDEIIMLDDGKILASASHDKLLESCPQYKDLYEEFQKTVKWRISND